MHCRGLQVHRQNNIRGHQKRLGHRCSPPGTPCTLCFACLHPCRPLCPRQPRPGRERTTRARSCISGGERSSRRRNSVLISGSRRRGAAPYVKTIAPASPPEVNFHGGMTRGWGDIFRGWDTLVSPERDTPRPLFRRGRTNIILSVDLYCKSVIGVGVPCTAAAPGAGRPSEWNVPSGHGSCPFHGVSSGDGRRAVESLATGQSRRAISGPRTDDGCGVRLRSIFCYFGFRKYVVKMIYVFA